MRDVNRIEARTAQGAGLSAGGRNELSSSNGNCGNAQVLQPDRVVQTARCARPSIGQSFNYGIHAAQLLDYSVGSVPGESGLFNAQDFIRLILFSENLFQAIQKEAAAGLTDVQQADLLPCQVLETWWRRGGADNRLI